MTCDIMEKFGPVDLLFNNAGIFHKGTVDLPFEQFKEMIEINLKAAFDMLQEIVSIMTKQESGQ